MQILDSKRLIIPIEKTNPKINMFSRLLLQLRSSSLLQCRSISKTSSHPITFHNQTIQESPDSVFMVTSDFRNASVIIDKKGTISPRILPWSQHICIYLPMSNSCNGLILIPDEDDNNLYLFNPSTNFFTNVMDLNDTEHCKAQDHLTTLGLYYDASIDDYKALLLLTHKYSEDHFCAYASLKEKNWIEIDCPFYPHEVQQGPLLHGHLHWIVYRLDGVEPNCIIAYFDPIVNGFEIFPSPPHKKEFSILGLGVIDGCLWMARYSSKEQLVEVLKMKEYGVAESWTSMFVFEEDLKVCQSFNPLFETENGRILFSKYRYYNNEILVYDPETNLCTTLCTSGARALQMIPFVKNIASPNDDY